MAATYIKKIMHNMICVTDMYSREIIGMFTVSQESGLVKDFDIGIYSDTLNAISVTLFMVLLIELYLFIPSSMTLTILKGHSSAKHS